MNPEYRCAYVLGFLESTLGSVRKYTADDMRRRIQIAVKVLKGEDSSEDLEFAALMQKDAERQRILDGEMQQVM